MPSSLSGPGLTCSHICIAIVTIRFAGVASPEEIVAAAAEQNMPAVALTDTNGLYAAVPFYKAAQAAAIKPIVGVVLTWRWRANERRFLDCGPDRSGPRSE